ncbi:hypothetical protein CPB86DRAFT_797242 [Serendipita vermifera]|nr:hypothetical protein CPB86DRAFT_797242 [Serendipita vermifera]
MMQPSTRKALGLSPLKKGSPLKSLVSGNGTTPPRPSTPTRNASSRSSTPVVNNTSPSRNLTGMAKDSILTKQADAALASLESTLQAQTDAVMEKLEQMSARVTALDETIQDLLRDDFGDPDRSSTPRANKGDKPSVIQEAEYGPNTSMFPPDTGTPLLSEESPFFEEEANLGA